MHTGLPGLPFAPEMHSPEWDRAQSSIPSNSLVSVAEKVGQEPVSHLRPVIYCPLALLIIDGFSPCEWKLHTNLLVLESPQQRQRVLAPRAVIVLYSLLITA